VCLCLCALLNAQRILDAVSFRLPLNRLPTNQKQPPQDDEAAVPTASMLSHVYALKDILTAIRAAGVIVHDYGVADYVSWTFAFALALLACRDMLMGVKGLRFGVQLLAWSQQI
jgi:hypothetical protein